MTLVEINCNSTQIQNVFKPIATSNVRDESIKFARNTDLVIYRKDTNKTSFDIFLMSQAAIIQLPSYQTNTLTQLF